MKSRVLVVVTMVLALVAVGAIAFAVVQTGKASDAEDKQAQAEHQIRTLKAQMKRSEDVSEVNKDEAARLGALLRAATSTTTTTLAPALRYPSGDPVLPGYPKLVAIAVIDSRVASSFDNAPSDQAVEVAPGVFTPYNPAVPDIEDYLDLPNDGDCAVREKYFPSTGGSCWNGVAGT